ncbi:hypothetical protein BJX63DRAFT_151312 [Aspergillus granulosus]|uniref:Uncharacterized protein n=1 Tax=Aspergillus granulosus TaxID=176169 RepID=A0ABR4HKF0_9EURO
MASSMTGDPCSCFMLLNPCDDNAGWSMGLLRTHRSTYRKLSSSLTHHRWNVKHMLTLAWILGAFLICSTTFVAILGGYTGHGVTAKVQLIVSYTYTVRDNGSSGTLHEHKPLLWRTAWACNPQLVFGLERSLLVRASHTPHRCTPIVMGLLVSHLESCLTQPSGKMSRSRNEVILQADPYQKNQCTPPWRRARNNL